MLAIFYLSGIPVSGAHQPGAEGAYLIVNKTLIETAGVCALLAFDTGRLAGLDMLWERGRSARTVKAREQTAGETAALAG